MNRRDFLKLAGLGAGALIAPRIAKAQMENDMTIQIDSFSGGFYNSATDVFEWDSSVSATLHYPGVVVGVSIFGAASVVSVEIFQDGTPSQYLTFVRRDSNADVHSEVWYLPNLAISGEVTFIVNLSAAVDSVAGACVYNYFGGIGTHEGGTGTSTPLAEVTVNHGVNSIVFGSFSINMTTNPAVVDQNERWNTPTGSGSHGVGADYGPSDSGSYIMTFQTSGTVAWAMSVVELLDYQSNPPAVMMGSGF